jgi:hypothetical protein
VSGAASTSITDVALGAGDRLGRNFSLISYLPSLAFVGYLYMLLAGGAFGGQFTPAQLATSLNSMGLTQGVLLAIAALALGVVLHPFQFALTQLLEGYWGPSRLGVALASWRVSAHVERRARLEADRQGAQKDLLTIATDGQAAWLLRNENDEVEIWKAINSRLGFEFAGAVVAPYIRYEALAAAASAYPEDGQRIMPTRLGNALRRLEDQSGQQYGLDLIVTAQQLHFGSEPAHKAYVADTKQQLDLTVRVCILAMLATLITGVLLASDGWWVLFAFVPYATAYLAYRGSISAARAYGSALAAVIDTNRFRLYELLHLPLPKDTFDERRQNARLMKLMAGGPGSMAETVPYSHPTA